MYDASTKEGTAFPTNIADYMNVTLPNWQTPVEWCTQTGYDQMVAIGQYLFHTYLSQADNLHVSFVTDTIQRDVSSAFALEKGLAEAAQGTKTTIHGLNNLEYDPYLFHPLEILDNADMTSYGSGGPKQLCQDPDPNQLNADIESRINNSVTPLLSLKEAIDLIEHYVGVGSAGSLHDIWTSSSSLNSDADTTSSGSNGSINSTTTPNEFTLNLDLHKLEGPINIVKAVAQMAFYARSSHIDNPPFLPNMTVSDMMDLLSWHYWSRSVTDVGTVEAAMSGSVLVHRILQALQQHHVAIPSSSSVEENHHFVTFLIGHDGDLDAVATSLDITWELPEPYPSSLQAAAAQDLDKRNSNNESITVLPSWYPTPPASALYFAAGESFVDISYLAPDPLDATKGNLGRFAPQLRDSDAEVVDEVAVRISASDVDPVQALRTRMIQILSAYYAPQGMECYRAALDFYVEEALETPSPTRSPVAEDKVVPTTPTTIPPAEAPNGEAASPPPPNATTNEQTPTWPPHHPYSSPTTTQNHPTWPPRPHSPTSSSSGNLKTGSSSAAASSTSSSTMVFLAVGIVFVGLLVLLRKPIAQGLGLGSRPIRYSDMDTQRQHDLDFSMELT
ncbi:hypothetical protein ACA910_012694 [Epithemia clementina (nom. ined.)]